MKSRKGRSPIKQIPVESFFAALGKPMRAAIARTCAFCIAPSGKQTRASCAWLSEAKKKLYFLLNHTLCAVQCRLGPGGGYARSGQLQSFAHRARAHVQQRL